MSPPTLGRAEAAQLPTQIWLASKSPRRKNLLETLGIAPQVFLAQTGPEAERLEEPQPNETPLPYVRRVTKLKLKAALEALHAQQHSGLVLAADTTVALNQEILGKPSTPHEATVMLETLSNQTHQVHTAVAVAQLNGNGQPRIQCEVQTSEVEFAKIPKLFIRAYIESGEPFDKAGGYGIQGPIAQFIRNIHGSHSGIMGLPLFETAALLRVVNTHPAQQPGA